MAEERKYIAFISYRHLPVEMSVAKKLHKRIEHFRIPKDLQKDGKTKPGLVFRDQDELLISSDLNDNIEKALDSSEFLIVICSPETVRSRWVLGEIDYFLKHHSRDHVLAVLTEGTPDTAFPPQLTRGDGPDSPPVEPLAANLLAENEWQRSRLFRTESLRILAALIGCRYDDLYRREAKYRRRRTAAAVSAAGLVAAAFIGMLLNRNAEIRAQLEHALISESRALAALSENAAREGDRKGALRYALEALPGGGRDRPYVTEAELALSGALGLYRQGVPDYAGGVEQDTSVFRAALSGDGSLFATADAYGCVRVFRTETGALLHTIRTDPVSALLFASEDSVLLTPGPSGTSAFRMTDGSLLWHSEMPDGMNLLAPSGDRTVLLASDYAEPARSEEESVFLISADTGETLRSLPLSASAPRYCPSAVLSPDASLAALVLLDPVQHTASLILCDFVEGVSRELPADLPYAPGGADFRLIFTPDGDLVLACDHMNDVSFVLLFDRDLGWDLRFRTEIETEKNVLTVNGRTSDLASLDFLAAKNGLVAAGSKHHLMMLSEDDGTVIWHRTLPGTILAAEMYENGTIGLVLSDGTVTVCTSDGLLGYTMDFYSFSCGYDLFSAGVSGGSYPESIFAVIPESSRQRASFIRFADSGSMFPMASLPDGVSRFVLIPSPSGNLLACLMYSPASQPLAWILLDVSTKESSDILAFPAGDLPAGPGLLALTDSGELTGAVPDDSSLPDLYPEDRSVVRTLPVCSGSLYAVFSDSGLVRICTEDGSELTSFRTDPYQVFFEADGVYSASVSADGGRLLLFYDTLSRTEPFCMTVDLEGRGCIGCFEGPAAYLPADDSVLVFQKMDGLYLSPFWSREELIGKAEAVLDPGSD